MARKKPTEISTGNVLVGYKRVSTLEQASEGTSLATQEQKLYGWAAIKGAQICKVFEDSQTGDNLWRQGLWDALQRLNCLECETRPMPELALRNEGWLTKPACTCGKLAGADGLIVWDMKRLSRKSRDLIFLINDVLTANGKRLIICNGQGECDTSTPQGRFVTGMFALLAEMDKDELLDKLHDGWAQAKKENRYAAGGPPYGFALERGKRAYDKEGRLVSKTESRLVPREDEIQVIQYILTMYYKKIPFTQMVKKLEKETPYRTRRGTFFDRKQLYRIINGPEGQYHIACVKEMYEKLNHQAIYDAKKINVEELAKRNAPRLDTMDGAKVS